MSETAEVEGACQPHFTHKLSNLFETQMAKIETFDEIKTAKNNLGPHTPTITEKILGPLT